MESTDTCAVYTRFSRNIHMTGRILILEDDSNLIRAMAQALKSDGHTVAPMRDRDAALRIASAGMAHNVMLSADMPSMPAVETLQRRPPRRTSK